LEIKNLIKKYVGIYNDGIKKLKQRKKDDIYNQIKGIKKINLEFSSDILESNSALYKDLREKLNKLLGKVENIENKFSDYYKILDFLNTSIGLLEGDNSNDIKNNESPVNDIFVFSDILNYVPNERRTELKNILLTILKNEKDKLTNYLSNISDFNPDNDDDVQLDYKKYKEFEIYFRKKFQPILEQLKDIVDSKEILEEINQFYKDLINDNYSNSKNDMLNFYFETIFNLFEEIQKMTNDEIVLKKLKYLHLLIMLILIIHRKKFIKFY